MIDINKIKRSNKLYIWYSALSADLIFYIAISTIYLATVKNFSAAQITLIATIGTIAGLMLQVPLMKCIQKIGNTYSSRIGTFLLLISSILLTVGQQFYVFIIAKILCEISFVFKEMEEITLKNNMKAIKEDDQYIRYRSKRSTLYAISTAVIALFIGTAFNINAYLPMILGILDCAVCFIMSFFIFDVTEKQKEDKLEKIEAQKTQIKKQSIKLTKTLIYIFLIYGIFYGVVLISQKNSELFIKEALSNYFTLEYVTQFLSMIIFASRVGRVLFNMKYEKLYHTLKEKTANVLILALVMSSVLLLMGYYYNVTLIVKFILMAVGYTLIVSLRDGMKLYMQNLLLEKYETKLHQVLFNYLSFARKLGSAVIGLIISGALVVVELKYTVMILLVIASINIILIRKLQASDTKNKKIYGVAKKIVGENAKKLGTMT